MVDAHIAVMGLMQTLLHAKKARAKVAACCGDHGDGDKGGNDGGNAAGTGIKFQMVNASGGQCQALNIHGQGGQQQQ